MQKYNILLVDDDIEDQLKPTKDLLEIWGYNVDAFSSGEEAIECIASGVKEYAVAVMDYKMPGKSGTDAATEIRKLNDEIIILIHSAYPSLESLRATITAGALNFIDKNEDLSLLREWLAKACQEYEKVRKAKPPLTVTQISQLIASIGMVGRSEKLARIAEQVHKYRASKSPVLVLGDTGVGKEMVAQAIHVGPKSLFFAVNCAAFQGSNLVESELFGYEKGAFTGAVARKVGILEAAKGGTVFLDEIHCLDLQTQNKLLRALREKKIRRVQGLREEPIDIRVIVSSRPDLKERVKNGTFLKDLYYRIKFLEIEIPSLREKPEDIEPLVHHFCEKYFQETGTKKRFLMRAIRRLEQLEWDGNVGELDGTVTSLLTNYSGDVIDESTLDTGIPNSMPTYRQLEAKHDAEKRELLRSAIRVSNSMRHAAQLVGLKPSSFHTLLERMGLKE